MTRAALRLSGYLLAAAAGLVLAAAPAQARNTWNQRTILQFSQPVLVPGAVLQPGTYVVRLANSPADRHIVQIFRQDNGREDLVATALTEPIQRTRAIGDLVLRFATSTGIPALKAFFYPGTLDGQQFIYPQADARAMASTTHQLVLATNLHDSMMQTGTLALPPAHANGDQPSRSR